MQTALQATKSRLQIQSDSCVDNEHKPLLHGSNGGTIKGSIKKSGTAVRQRRHVHFSEANTEQEMKGSQLPHKDCDVRYHGCKINNSLL
jgi:RNA:NAD 2'-phosphotransferase (TPT1/KptA family)